MTPASSDGYAQGLRATTSGQRAEIDVARRINQPPRNLHSATVAARWRGAYTRRPHSAILGAMKLYFAGPLFTTPERTWNAEVTAALRAAGHEVFLPQEQEPGRDRAGIFATDVGGIDWAEGMVAIMDGPDPDSGTSWEVGYAFGLKKWIVLVRTDIRARSDGDYNAMLMEAATIRIDMPAALTVEVIARLLDALARIETGSA
jgi:nucleoside 2-deoxyribosyltransferase